MVEEDESEFLLDEYHSDKENNDTRSRNADAIGTNLSPEVLKMIEQMAPIAPAEKEDEPNEIKVLIPGNRRGNEDILCFKNTFTAISIRRRT